MSTGKPICRDCGQSHPGLTMWTLGNYSSRDVRDCLRALIRRVDELERASSPPGMTAPAGTSPPRTEPSAEDPCLCGRARDEHGGPYGEGACAESGCEVFERAPSPPETTPPPRDDEGRARWSGDAMKPTRKLARAMDLAVGFAVLCAAAVLGLIACAAWQLLGRTL